MPALIPPYVSFILLSDNNYDNMSPSDMALSQWIYKGTRLGANDKRSPETQNWGSPVIKAMDKIAS